MIEPLLGFVAAVREAGVAAPADRVRLLVEALDQLGPQRLYWAGRLTLCTSRDDIGKYDRVFRKGTKSPDTVKHRIKLETSAVQGLEASPGEVLRHRDYATLTERERGEAARMLALLAPVAPQRPSRRHRKAPFGPVDTRRTTREMLAALGEPARLRRQRRRTRPRRVVFILDISGSMAPYADLLLRFAHAAVRARPTMTEVFTIATRLTRVTGAMRKRDMDAALENMVPDWRGGTRLGEALTVYLRRFGHRGMARGAIVVICSDGWECGDATELGEAMAWLARLAGRIVWVTPHAAKAGFVPATAGLRAAGPHVDELVAGHSIAALTEVLKR
ncbi:MAG TPA: VWA domain-containing protein [Candidatus Limnocylindrales bacterium]|nr:VWA domain-containing protein [Candidatus Limnocylindrales bacterium]